MSGRQASLHQTHPVIPHVVCVLEVRHMHACVCMRVRTPGDQQPALGRMERFTRLYRSAVLNFQSYRENVIV